MPNLTSSAGSGLPFLGTQLQFGVGTSPGSMTAILNVQEWALPMKQELWDVTNSGNTFRRRRPTLADLGPGTFKFFWQPNDVSMKNVVGGIRYCVINGIKVDFQAIYPADDLSAVSSDAFQGFFVEFSITGKVGTGYEGTAAIQADDQSPSLK